MKLLTSNVEIWEQKNGLDGIYEQIERVGRLCYASENNIKPGSAKPFVDRLGNAGHGKSLEHGTVYLTLPHSAFYQTEPGGENIQSYIFYQRNPYSKCIPNDDWSEFYITTNYRVLYENNRLGDLDYLSSPTDKHEKRICIHFTCDRGVSAEANRHTVNSALERSTRYCNYSKDKFGNQISIIQPQEVDPTLGKFSEEDNQTVQFRHMCGSIFGTSAISNEELLNSLEKGWNEVDFWLFGNMACEISYLGLLKCGWKPQQARRVLPLDLHTELCHTAFVSDWKNFIRLRSAEDAHPDIKILSDRIKELLKDYLLDEQMSSL